MHFVLPLNSPLLRPSATTEEGSTSDTPQNPKESTSSTTISSSNLTVLPATLNRFQTPPLTAQSAGAPLMNSPYSRMCDQLEHFVDAEIEFTDNLLFNRPLNERNPSVDLSPELEKASVSAAVSTGNALVASPPTTSNPPIVESRSLWLGNVDPTVTEQEIRSAFEPFGPIENIRLLPAKECAFVNYFDMESAIRGRNAMQGRPLGNMILRIGFGKIADAVSTTNLNVNTMNSVGSRSVWIGNLGPEITSDLLMHHFNVFGPIESCRVLEAKSCAFVNFYSAEAAAVAKAKMNGAAIGNSIIKTGNVKDTGMSVGESKRTSSQYSQTQTQQTQTQQTTVTFASIIQSTGECEEESETDSAASSGSDGAQLREFRRQVEATPEEIPAILKKLMKRGDLNDLAVDSYGNILMQKIIERAQLPEQQLIMNTLKGHMVDIAKQKNGTWVIQKLITCAVDASIQAGTIAELKDHAVELLEDQFGNYVIQCILTACTGDEKEIVDRIVQNSRKLAIGKFSSRALKSILDASNPARQKQLAHSLARESVLLSVDPNGAVVIQWILDSDLAGRVALVTTQLQGRLAQVALTKQGGVIVARIIGSSEDPAVRDSAILELYELAGESLSSDTSDKSNNHQQQHPGFKSSKLDSLLAEPATCSILFKAFQISKPAIRLRLAAKLKPKLMALLKEVTGERDEHVIEGYSDRERDEKIPVHLVKLYQELIKRRD